MTKIYSVISETKYVCSLSRPHYWKSILCTYRFACRYVKEKPQTYTECLTQRGQYCAIDYNGIIILIYCIAGVYLNYISHKEEYVFFTFFFIRYLSLI